MKKTRSQVSPRVDRAHQNLWSVLSPGRALPLKHIAGNGWSRQARLSLYAAAAVGLHLAGLRVRRTLWGGFHLPFMPSKEDHDYHHAKLVV